MAAWQVYLYGIEWDDSSDDAELPENLRVTIHADDAETEAEATELALAEAADEFGSDVAGTEQINVTFA